MFSIHLNRTDIGIENRYWCGFKAVITDDVHTIAGMACTFVISPIIWSGGFRKKINFFAANWIGLDFDSSPLTLTEAVDIFKPYTHVIGPSKHHQLPKPSRKDPKKIEPARDRFHVFLKLPITIHDCQHYEAVVRYYVNAYKADWQAIDGARKFNPCREIVSVVEGETILPKKKMKTAYVPKENNLPSGSIPRWILQLLQFGVGFGVSRNTTCYKIAVHLKKAGFSENDVVDMLMVSPIPIGPETRDEVVRAVRSGFR